MVLLAPDLGPVVCKDLSITKNWGTFLRSNNQYRSPRLAVGVGVASGTGSRAAPPPPPTPHDHGGRQGRCLSHLIGGAEGGLAELADLPDVFPGHDPSPPETPTYHALDVGVQAQRRRALRFAAGRRDGEYCERTQQQQQRYISRGHAPAAEDSSLS